MTSIRLWSKTNTTINISIVIVIAMPTFRHLLFNLFFLKTLKFKNKRQLNLKENRKMMMLKSKMSLMRRIL